MNDASHVSERNTAPMNHPTKATNSLLPRIPYIARVTTDPDVPDAGPLAAMMPGKTHSSDAATITAMDCHSSSPSRMSVAPIVRLRMLTFGAAQMKNRSRARPCRSASSMSSMPRVSTRDAVSTYSSWGAWVWDISILFFTARLLVARPV
jgi:hypothetical protein